MTEETTTTRTTTRAMSAAVRAWRWMLSRLFANAPNAPTRVRAVGAPGTVEISWTPGPRAGTYNVEDEEHVVSVRFVDGACGEALRGCGEDGWMDVYVGTERTFALRVPGGADAGALEARVRAENASGTSAWVAAEERVRALDGRAVVEEEDANGEWGAHWGASTRASTQRIVE